MEEELVDFREKQANFENRSATLKQKEERMSATLAELKGLQEAVHQAELAKLLQEQTVRELAARVRSLEGNEQLYEDMLRERQEQLTEAAKALKAQRVKTHKVNEKVCHLKQTPMIVYMYMYMYMYKHMYMYSDRIIAYDLTISMREGLAMFIYACIVKAFWFNSLRARNSLLEGATKLKLCHSVPLEMPFAIVSIFVEIVPFCFWPNN